MIRVGRSRQRLGSPLLDAQLDRNPLRAHFGQAELVGAVARDDDQIHPRREQFGPEAETLATQSLHPISAHRTADPARDDHPEPRGSSGARLGGHEQGEVRRADAAARPLRTNELGMSAQPAVRPEIEGHYFL